MKIKIVYCLADKTTKRQIHTMQNKDDLRVIRTKKALSDAFIELLNNKTFDEVTVNELCDKAGIRRATFYKHYSDKYDFLTSYTRSLRDRFENSVWKSKKPGATKEYYVAYAKRLVLFISENSKAIDNVVKSSLFHSVISVIVEQNYKDTCERLNASVASGMKLNASVEVTASMCAGGVANAIYNWLKNGKSISTEELAEQIGAVVTAAIGQK